MVFRTRQGATLVSLNNNQGSYSRRIKKRCTISRERVIVLPLVNDKFKTTANHQEQSTS